MQLPSELLPWATQLSVFPRDVALGLGPLVRRLGVAIGGLDMSEHVEAAEPDGFAGLDRRGPYERLLASEWALLDEIPEEFVRRAAEGEHLFLHVSRREPSRSRESLVLFDAGPSQIGSPRIVHLAVLIVLARRAAAAGAGFAWGVLQGQDDSVAVPIDAVTPASVMKLLRGRTCREAAADDLARWRERAPGGRFGDDLWVVGGPRALAIAAIESAGQVLVEDPLEPEASFVRARVKQASATPKELALELPSERLSSRLLRDPFAGAVAAPAPIRRESKAVASVVFDPGGVKLFAKTGAGGMITFPVPNSPSAGVGRARYSDDGGSLPVAAVGRSFRATTVVKMANGCFHVHSFRRSRGAPPDGWYGSAEPQVAFADATADTPISLCVAAPGDPPPGELYVLDGERRLARLVAPHTRPEGRDGLELTGVAFHVASDVVALAQVRTRMVFVGREHPDQELRIVSIGTTIARRAVDGADAAMRAFIGYSGSHSSWEHGLVAIEVGANDWLLFTGTGKPERVPVPRSARAIGVLGPHDGGAGVIAVEDDNRRVALYGSRSRRDLFTAPADIVCAACTPAYPVVACATVDGQVQVYSVYLRAWVCRFRMGGAGS